MELRSRRLDATNMEEEDSDSIEDTTNLLVSEEDPEPKVAKMSLKGDERNIAVLLFLYVLQGIPLGLAAAVPLILTNKHVSYRQQAEFSFAYWPFSVKLLWAPLVDSLYVRSFGRRKTWLVPVQYLIGVTMLLLAQNVDYYLESSHPDVFRLTCMFFFLNFLAATQDIAVDGWALTMLQRHNVGYASTCNSVGQTAGYFLGYVFYMALESYGVLRLPDFLNFWAIIFIVATTFVAVFKHEKKEDEENDDHHDLGLVGTYKMLYKIVRLPLMPVTVVVLLTSKIGFSAADSVTGLKLIEAGVPKEQLAMLAIPMIPMQIMLPWIISKYTAGPKPMDVFLKAMPARLVMGMVFAAVVYVTPWFKDEKDGSFSLAYYGMLLFIYALHQVTLYSMFVSIMAFFARISDPAVGGTYMTMLNTLTNLGGNWPATLALWAVDLVTWKKCQVVENINSSNFTVGQGNVCDGAEETAECQKGGGECITEVEGYYIESFICVIIGVLWLALFGWRTIKRLQDADEKQWRVVKSKRTA